MFIFLPGNGISKSILLLELEETNDASGDAFSLIKDHEVRGMIAD